MYPFFVVKSQKIINKCGKLFRQIFFIPNVTCFCLFLDQEGTNVNNLLTVVEVDDDGSETTYTPFTYVYDKDGFPTTIKVKWEKEDDIRTYTLTYITK